jgi:hypothetical protein
VTAFCDTRSEETTYGQRNVTPSPWNATRAKAYKGKSCIIFFPHSDAHTIAEIHFGGEVAFVVSPNIVRYGKPTVCICTDHRVWKWDPETAEAAGTRYMMEGVVNGLESNRAALAGRHPVHQAISLAVHLGFSRIVLESDGSIGTRVRRALDTLVRPLRGHKVTVTGMHPFPPPEPR